MCANCQPETRFDYRSAWAAWACATAVSFGVLEAVAVRSRCAEATLSAHLRMTIGVQPQRPWGRIGAAVFAGGLAVLASHVIWDRP